MAQSETTTSFQWVRPPRQSRSQESLERILDAAEQVISERGFDQATVAEIVRRANSSVGAFYGRFKEKDALLRCLHERFCEEAFATVDAVLDPERWRGESIGQILTETVPFLVDAYRQRGGMFAAFMVRATYDPSFTESWASVGAHLVDRFRTLLLERCDEIDHPNPRLAIEFGLQMMLCTLDEMALFRDVEPAGGLTLFDERLPEQLATMFLRYLGVPHSAIAKQRGETSETPNNGSE